MPSIDIKQNKESKEPKVPKININKKKYDETKWLTGC